MPQVQEWREERGEKEKEAGLETGRNGMRGVRRGDGRNREEGDLLRPYVGPSVSQEE